jgi:hypothetical protein
MPDGNIMTIGLKRADEPEGPLIRGAVFSPQAIDRPSDNFRNRFAGLPRSFNEKAVLVIGQGDLRAIHDDSFTVLHYITTFTTLHHDSNNVKSIPFWYFFWGFRDLPDGGEMSTIERLAHEITEE